MEPIEPYAEECKCDGDFVWVERVVSNGTKQYGKQCLVCGKMNIVRRTLVPFDVELLPFDQQIRENYHERRRRFYERRWQQNQSEIEAQKEEERLRWWEKYNRYLETPAWKDKRRRVLERDGGLCQACRKRTATEVHHLTYKHAFNEPLFDLIAICGICHKELTETDRCQRN